MRNVSITIIPQCSVLALAVALSTLYLVLAQGTEHLDDWKLLLPCAGGLVMLCGCRLIEVIVAVVKKQYGLSL